MPGIFRGSDGKATETGFFSVTSSGVLGRYKLASRNFMDCMFLIITVPKTNKSHLKIGRAPKGKQSYNHPFSDAMLLLGSVRNIDQCRSAWEMIDHFLHSCLNMP